MATTRSDPPLRLGRLRTRGALGEIQSRDLAFDPDEARELFALEGIELDDDDLALLVQRTEGWPAGLYLAALWLGLDDVAQGVRDFAGDNRHVADYLSAEVLAALPPDRRTFMLHTAVLERFSASLCDEVLRDRFGDRAAGARELEHVPRPLDARWEWFRYHHLFAELLRLELNNEDQEAAPEPGGLPPGATTTISSRTPSSTRPPPGTKARSSTSSSPTSSSSRTGRAATLLAGWTYFQTELLLENPGLPAVGAISAALVARPGTERHRHIALAERARDLHPERWTPYHESLVNVVRRQFVEGSVTAAIEHARRAEIDDPDVAVTGWASLAYSLLLAGDLVEARAAAQNGAERPEAPCGRTGSCTRWRPGARRRRGGPHPCRRTARAPSSTWPSARASTTPGRLGLRTLHLPLL